MSEDGGTGVAGREFVGAGEEILRELDLDILLPDALGLGLLTLEAKPWYRPATEFLVLFRSCDERAGRSVATTGGDEERSDVRKVVSYVRAGVVLLLSLRSSQNLTSELGPPAVLARGEGREEVRESEGLREGVFTRTGPLFNPEPNLEPNFLFEATGVRAAPLVEALDVLIMTLLGLKSAFSARFASFISPLRPIRAPGVPRFELFCP